jgi:hypothetical protein
MAGKNSKKDNKSYANSLSYRRMGEEMQGREGQGSTLIKK